MEQQPIRVGFGLKSDLTKRKSNEILEFNKTMYLLKRFNTDTLVSVKLKRTKRVI